MVVNWEKRQYALKKDEETAQKRAQELKGQIVAIVDRMKVISNETALKMMEEDIVKLEDEIVQVQTAKSAENDENRINIHTIVKYVKYFMEHLDELLIHHCNPVNKAAYFSVLFDKVPTYQEIKDGTLKTAQLPEVNELFRALNGDVANMVISPGILWYIAPSPQAAGQ